MTIRSVAAILCAFTLAACATPPELIASNYYPAKPEEAASITSGGMGAVIADFKTGKGCDSIAVLYRNLDTKATVTRLVTRTYEEKTDKALDAGDVPFLVVMPPGRYEFRAGICTYKTYGYNVIYTHRASMSSALWIEPFEVKAGEVVYSGTAFPEEIHPQWGIALTPQETLSGRTERSFDRYSIYEIRDASADVRASLARYNPALTGRFVARVTPALLDKEVVRKIITDAFAAEAGGVPPDDATAKINADKARARVQENLLKYVVDQLKAKNVTGVTPDAATARPSS